MMFRKFALLLAVLFLLTGFTACAWQSGPTEPDYDQFTNPPVPEVDYDVEELSTVVSEDTIAELENYTHLKKLDLSGSTCYAAIKDYMEAHPEVDVTFTVSLGGSEISRTTTGLILEPGTFHYITLINNLQYLPNVTSVSLPKTDLSLEQIQAFMAAYPKVAVDYSFQIGGVEYGSDTTEMDLSAFDPAQLDALVEKLPLLSDLTSVNLMDAEGSSAFTMEQVKQLKQAAPNAVFNYTFQLFGTTVSAADQRLDFTNQKLGNEAAEELRAALDILPKDVYIKVENCGFDNETLGAIQQDYPEAYIVWRVWYGNQNQLTDAETIRHVYNLTDGNCGNMKYFTKAKYLDLGHNETLRTIEFCAYMPHLEVLIVSGSLVSDMTPLQNCTKLWWLELAFCSKVTDITPLSGCESLRNLNLSFTGVTDIKPILELPLKQFVAIKNEIPDEDEVAFDETHPDTITLWRGKQPYGYGWRYIDDGYTFGEDYLKIREVFDLDAVDKRLQAQQNANKNK